MYPILQCVTVDSFSRGTFGTASEILVKRQYTLPNLREMVDNIEEEQSAVHISSDRHVNTSN